MKKSKCYLLLAILIFVLATPLIAQWVQTSEPSGAVFSLGVSGKSLLAGTWNGVYRSTDYGDTWNLTLPTSIKDFTVDSVAGGNRIIYAGGHGGVYISRDDGINWRAVNSGLENREVRSIAIIPDESEGSTLLAGTGEGVFRSSNYGTSWVPSSPTILDVYALTVFKDETGDIIVLAGIETEYNGLGNCIFRSTDNGQSWIETSLPTLWAGSFAIIPNETSGRNIFAGTYSGVYLSTDNGTNWTHLNIGEQRSVWTFTTSTNEMGNMNLFAGTFLGGVFLTTNNGTDWTTVNSGLPYEDDWIYSLEVLDPYIFAGTSDVNGGVWRRPLSEMITSIEGTPEIISAQFSLEQNYPNPFNPSSVISYQLPVNSNVTLKVYDILGNEVATLVNEEKSAGQYEVEFSAEGLTSGIYFYQLRSGSFIETKKMILMK
jgi:photosystem II stability/assembly factor-like uncharacterized protein